MVGAKEEVARDGQGRVVIEKRGGEGNGGCGVAWRGVVIRSLFFGVVGRREIGSGGGRGDVGGCGGEGGMGRGGLGRLGGGCEGGSGGGDTINMEMDMDLEGWVFRQGIRGLPSRRERCVHVCGFPSVTVVWTDSVVEYLLDDI